MHRPRTLTVAAALAAVLLVVAAPAMASGGGQGAVYTLTNAASGNAVAVFDRANDGSLTPDGTVATGGNGTGAGLRSQGALVLDDDRLLAVNAGSNTISLLQVDRRGKVTLADVEAQLTQVLAAGRPSDWPVPPLWDGRAGERIARTLSRELGWPRA